MATRSAFIYEQAKGEFDLTRLCEVLEPLGLTLEHPTKGAVLMLNNEGDQISISQVELEARIRRGVDTSFQFWYSEDHDLFARVRRNLSIRIIEFGLEGTNEGERTALGGALRKYFDEQAEAGLGLVFDPDGVIEDYDWDRFFIKGDALRQEVFSAGLPDLLLISHSLAHGAAGIPSRPYPNGIMVTRDRSGVFAEEWPNYPAIKDA